MQFLEQSDSITIRIGPFVNEDDGKTAETGLTITQADIRLSKNGGDFAQANPATGATHDEYGWYYLTLNATDTGTLGRLIVAIHESGALPVWREFMVVKTNYYDTLFGSDYLQVDVVQVEGVDATNQIRDSVVDDATLIDASALNALSGKAPTKAYLAGSADADGGIDTTEAAVILNQCVGALDSYDPPTDSEMVSAFTEIKGATWSSGSDTLEHIRDKETDIETDTQDLQTQVGTDGAGLTALGDTRLANLDAAVTTRAPAAEYDTEMARIDQNLSTTESNIRGADSDDLKDISDQIDGNSPSVIADAVWDELSTGHLEAGKAGQQLWTDLDAVLADTDEVQGKLPTNNIMGSGVLTDKDDEIDAIKGKTDNLPVSPAAVGSQMTLEDSAIAAAKVTAAAANKLADHAIRRTFQNACDSADGDTKSGRSLLGAIAKLVNKIAQSGSTLSIYEDDDTTALFTQEVTTAAGAYPVTELDTT